MFDKSLQLQLVMTFASFVIGVILAYFRLHFSIEMSIIASLFVTPFFFVFYRYVLQYRIIESVKDRTSKLPIKIGETND